MQNNNYKPNMVKRIGFGVMFSTLLPFALVLDGVIFLLKGATSSTNFDEDEKYLTQACWNAIGDCVEGKPIGSNNNLESEESGWFLKLLRRQSWWSSFPMEIVKSIACFLFAAISLGSSGLAVYSIVILSSMPVAPALGFVLLGLGGLAGLCGCVGLVCYGAKKIRNAVAKREGEQTFIKNCLGGQTTENCFDSRIHNTNDVLFFYSIQTKTTNTFQNSNLSQKYKKAKKIIQSNKNLETPIKKKILKMIYRAKPGDDIDSQINLLLKLSDIK